MKVRIQNIYPLSLAKITSCLHAIVGFFAGAVISWQSLSTSGQGEAGLGTWAVLVFPVLNALLGFLIGLCLAGCYNFLAGLLGGVQLQLEDEEAPQNFSLTKHL